jgi:hypothetical protein
MGVPALEVVYTSATTEVRKGHVVGGKKASKKYIPTWKTKITVWPRHFQTDVISASLLAETFAK